jgi:large subunit ribosomal protein L3
MVDLNRPRRGSMAYRPRKRASTQNVRVHWQDCKTKRVLGIAGYKAGMTHISYIDISESSTKGQEIVTSATVIEIPPMIVYGIRCYDNTRSLSNILTSEEKILKTLGITKKKEHKAAKEEDIRDVRLLAYCQPDKTKMGKKHIEAMEIGFGGTDVKEKMEYAKNLLGKELRAKDVFKLGEYVDVAAVTKGKGWQGAVKRFGVKTQRPKSTGKVRHVGTLGQWHPAYVLYTVPQAGQMGYHTRSEQNKMIMHIGEKPEEINPVSGFRTYGFVKNDYIIVKGSVPGPAKRLVKLKLSLRREGTKEPQIMTISTTEKV